MYQFYFNPLTEKQTSNSTLVQIQCMRGNAASFSSYSENRPRILNTAGFVQSSVTTPSFMADFYRQAPLQAKTHACGHDD